MFCAERGTTLFLTTHDMGDVERLCERIVVVDSGAVAYDGPLESFRQRLGAPRELIVDLEEPASELEPHATSGERASAAPSTRGRARPRLDMAAIVL